MYNKLFSKIIRSSIWLEPLSTRVVWISFLATMDEDGFVQCSALGNVATLANVTIEEATSAIKTLESPDEQSGNPDNAGRRIERVPGGWMILNAKAHRDLITRETQREQTKLRVQRYRLKLSGKSGNAGVPKRNKKVTLSEAEANTNTNTEVPVRDPDGSLTVPEVKVDGSLPLTIPTVGKVISGSPPKNSANPPPKETRKNLPTFFRPTLKEAADCFQELCRLRHKQGKGCEPIEAKEAEDWAEEFIEYYDNRDWKIGGKSKMKSWELTISDWIRRRIKIGWRSKSSNGHAARADNSPKSVWEIKVGIEEREKEIAKIMDTWKGRDRENPEGFRQAMERREKLKSDIENSKQQIIAAT